MAFYPQSLCSILLPSGLSPQGDEKVFDRGWGGGSLLPPLEPFPEKKDLDTQAVCQRSYPHLNAPGRVFQEVRVFCIQITRLSVDRDSHDGVGKGGNLITTRSMAGNDCNLSPRVGTLSFSDSREEQMTECLSFIAGVPASGLQNLT